MSGDSAPAFPSTPGTRRAQQRRPMSDMGLLPAAGGGAAAAAAAAQRPSSGSGHAYVLGRDSGWESPFLTVSRAPSSSLTTLQADSIGRAAAVAASSHSSGPLTGRARHGQQSGGAAVAAVAAAIPAPLPGPLSVKARHGQKGMPRLRRRGLPSKIGGSRERAGLRGSSTAVLHGVCVVPWPCGQRRAPVHVPAIVEPARPSAWPERVVCCAYVDKLTG